MQAKNPTMPCRPELWRIVEEANSRAEDSRTKVGLAIISREFEVLSANTVHLERWPDLVGTTCYRHCNSFTEPCSWCPVQRTFSDGGLHQAIAASPKPSSQQLEYSHIVSIPVHDDEGTRLDAALEVVFNLTKHQEEMIEVASGLHRFLKRLCSFLSHGRQPTFVANLLLLAAVSRKGLRLDEATVLQISVERGSSQHADYARTLKASAVDGRIDSLAELPYSHPELEASLDARMDIQEPGPKVSALLDITAKELSEFVDTDFPKRLDGRTIALSVKSSASPLRFVLILRSLAADGLLLDYQLNDAALLQALFSHAYDASRVAAPVGVALEKLKQLLNQLQQGGENVVFAAPVAFGLAHDLTPALTEVSTQVMCLEAELAAGKIQRKSLQQVLDKLKRAESRFKICRSRLQSVAALFKKTKKQRERCSLNSVIDEVHEWLSPEFDDHSVGFLSTADMRTTNDVIRADPVQVFQVVYNLVYNALKAVSVKAVPKRRRRVLVRTFESGDHQLVGLVVTDTAGSLLLQIQEYMYEPFFSTDSTGTGLGLWIVKSILDKLGVTIDVQVRHTLNTTFKVLLPREW